MPNTATATAVKISHYLRVQYLNGWAVIWEDGTVVEHSLPSQAAAEDRLAFHTDRVNAQQAWDDAHRHLYRTER